MAVWYILCIWYNFSQFYYVVCMQARTLEHYKLG
jgi:hypothetical protein